MTGKGRLASMFAGVAIGVVVAVSGPSLAAGGGTSESTAVLPAPISAIGAVTPAVAERSVSVSGEATIRSAPDEAVLSFGVQTEAASAEDAIQENAAKMVDVLRALAGLGLKSDDISTTGVNLYPTYGSSGMSITGYQATNHVSVTFHELDTIGKAIDEAVGAGANLTNGIMFQMSDANGGQDQALAAAVADARTKAAAVAAASDAQLGQVLTVTETSGPVFYPPMPYYGAEGGALDAAVSTPVDPPTLETQVSVQVTWALI